MYESYYSYMLHSQPRDGHADMTTLGDNGEWALLHNLRQRFKAEEIYTYVVPPSCRRDRNGRTCPDDDAWLAGMSAIFSSLPIRSKILPSSTRIKRGSCAPP